MVLPLCPIQPFWFSIARPYSAPSPSWGAGMNGGRQQLTHCEVMGPYAQILERRDHISRRPAPRRIPVRCVNDGAVRHLEVAAGMGSGHFGSNRKNSVGHTQRLQDVLLDEGCERLTGGVLDHHAEQDR